MLRRTALAVLTLVALLGLAVPATAHPSPANPWVSAAQTCKDLEDTRPAEPTGEPLTAYYVPVAYPQPVGVQPLAIVSYRGCVTTVAAAGGTVPVPPEAVSWIAFYDQCRALEREGVEYPYEFYGPGSGYVADNRLECVSYLRAFHLGELQPPGPPA